MLLWTDNERRLAARIIGEAELARRDADHSADHPGDEADTHRHGRLGAFVPCLLVLPLIALFVVQP